MFTHQYTNSIGSDLYNGYWYKNADWKLHFHRGYEFVWVLSGELRAVVADKCYLLKRGDALFVTPFALHSYTTDNFSEAFIAVFAHFSIASTAKYGSPSQLIKSMGVRQLRSISTLSHKKEHLG